MTIPQINPHHAAHEGTGLLDKSNGGMTGGGGAGGGGGGGVFDHAIEKERHRRCRLVTALAVGTTFLILVAFIAVWSAHMKMINARENNRDNKANNALNVLNQHLRAQSKNVYKGCESTLIVIRHCEKFGPHVTDNDGNVHCSYLGFERAKYIATLFGSSNTPINTDTTASSSTSNSNSNASSDNSNSGSSSSSTTTINLATNHDAGYGGVNTERWPAPQHLFALAPDRGDHWNFREWETLYPLSKKLGIDIDVVAKDDFAHEYFDLLRSGSLCGQAVVISWKHEFIPELVTSLGCSNNQGCPDIYPEDSFDQVWQLKFVFHPFDDSKEPTKPDENGMLSNATATTSVKSGVRDEPETPDDDHLLRDQPKDNDRNGDGAGDDNGGEGGGTDQPDNSDTGTDNNDNNGSPTDIPNNKRRLSSSNSKDDIEEQVRRYLKSSSKHHHHSKKKEKRLADSKADPLAGWSVYAAVTQEYFDPLAFSKLMGDYPDGGTKTGGRWAIPTEAYDEM